MVINDDILPFRGHYYLIITITFTGHKDKLSLNIYMSLADRFENSNVKLRDIRAPTFEHQKKPTTVKLFLGPPLVTHILENQC